MDLTCVIKPHCVLGVVDAATYDLGGSSVITGVVKLDVILRHGRRLQVTEIAIAHISTGILACRSEIGLLIGVLAPAMLGVELEATFVSLVEF